MKSKHYTHPHRRTYTQNTSRQIVPNGEWEGRWRLKCGLSPWMEHFMPRIYKHLLHNHFVEMNSGCGCSLKCYILHTRDFDFIFGWYFRRSFRGQHTHSIRRNALYPKIHEIDGSSETSWGARVRMREK